MIDVISNFVTEQNKASCVGNIQSPFASKLVSELLAT